MATAETTTSAVETIPTAGRVSSEKHKLFSAKGTRQRKRKHGPQYDDSVPNMRFPDRRPANATPTTTAATTGQVSKPARRIPAPSTSTKH